MGQTKVVTVEGVRFSLYFTSTETVFLGRSEKGKFRDDSHAFVCSFVSFTSQLEGPLPSFGIKKMAGRQRLEVWQWRISL